MKKIKKQCRCAYLLKRTGRKAKGITNDQQIALKDVDEPLRLVAYTDQDSNKEYHFITNAHHLKASEISAIYKERW